MASTNNSIKELEEWNLGEIKPFYYKITHHGRFQNRKYIYRVEYGENSAIGKGRSQEMAVEKAARNMIKILREKKQPKEEPERESEESGEQQIIEFLGWAKRESWAKIRLGMIILEKLHRELTHSEEPLENVKIFQLSRELIEVFDILGYKLTERHFKAACNHVVLYVGVGRIQIIEFSIGSGRIADIRAQAMDLAIESLMEEVKKELKSLTRRN